MADKFNMNGGNFAPLDYTRINNGGSHEENPNGGVQMGVDSQGTPNMVEQEESVYKDFVYSDNIIIDDEMIERYNLPKALKGLYYSEGADWFIDQISNNNDPIDNNGLNVGLARLAEAQEEQKEEQKAIQEQKNLEEELSKLSPEELTQLEQMLGGQEEAAPEQVGFAQGGPMGSTIQLFAETVLPEEEGNVGTVGTVGVEVEPPLTRPAMKIKQFQQNVRLLRNAEEANKSAVSTLMDANAKRDSLRTALTDARTAEQEALQNAYNAVLDGGNVKKATDDYDAAVKDKKRIRKEYRQSVVDANKARHNVTAAERQLGLRQSMFFKTGLLRTPTIPASDTEISFDDVPASTPTLNSSSRFTDLDSILSNADVILGRNKKEKGGLIRKYVNGSELVGADTKLHTVATPSIPWFVPNPTIVNPDRKISGWDTTMTGKPAVSTGLYPAGYEPSLKQGYIMETPVQEMPAYEPLPTTAMYTEPLLHGITALHNISQEPTQFSFNLAASAAPYARMNLERLSYTPEDINRLQNEVSASDAALASSIRNAGLGPSTGATLLAANAQSNINRGNAFAQSRAAQIARRNAVISANNQAAQAEANLAYAVDRDRAEALNRYNMLNAQYGLMTQRLNDEAEQAQFNSVGNELDALRTGLYNTARQNFIMNQINSNTALNNGLRQNGWSYRKVKNGGLLKKYKK